MNKAYKQDSRRMDRKNESTLRSFNLLDGQEMNFRLSDSRKGGFKDATMFSSDITEGFRMTMNSRMTDRRRSTKMGYQLPSIVQKFQPFPEEEDTLTLSVSCALHLGVLEDARKLPCEHAFCLACLVTIVNSSHSSRIQCPVCNVECDVPPGGPSGWPQAKFHNEVAEKVRNMRRASGQSIISGLSGPSPSSSMSHIPAGVINSTKADSRRRGSILQSADLLRDLVKKLVVKGDSAEAVEKTLLESDLKTLESKLETLHLADSPKLPNIHDSALPKAPARNRPLEDSHRKCNSTSTRPSSLERKYEMHNEAEVMRRCAKYRMHNVSLPAPSKVSLLKRKSTSSSMDGATTAPAEKEPTENAYIICSHIGTYKKQRHKVYAVLDSAGWITLRLSNKSKVVQFLPLADEVEESSETHSSFQGIYLKVAQESVFVTGVLNVVLPKGSGQPAHISSATVGCVLRYDLTGNLLSRSQPYPVTCREHNPVHGLDVDERNGRVFLAKPCTHEVTVLNMELEETGLQWCFLDSNIRLTYVCYRADKNEMWATCAVKQALLYLDLTTNDYRIFYGEALFKSSPTHIVSTSDNRVIFLDELEGRLYWVSRCNTYLCIQRLIIRNTKKSFRPEWLQNIGDSYIMLDNGKTCMVGGPNRDLNLNKRANCVIS